MSIRDDKEKIIKEIMDLRTMIQDVKSYNRTEVIDLKEKAQTQLNKIHNMVFNI